VVSGETSFEEILKAIDVDDDLSNTHEGIVENSLNAYENNNHVINDEVTNMVINDDYEVFDFLDS